MKEDPYATANANNYIIDFKLLYTQPLTHL